jgi:pimeloyl-ACP methyl ester carboxylesterase
MADRATSSAAIVFLHGTGGHPAQWNRICEAFGGSRRMIRQDLPSHRCLGGSAARMAAADEAQALVRAWGNLGAPVHLVGHSYGGALALRIALQFPARVQSLTLIEPAAFHFLRDGSSLEQSMFADIARLEARIRQAADAGDPASGVAQFLDFWSGPQSWDRLPGCRRALLAGQADLILGNFAAIFGESTPLASCSTIACPVLGVIGDQSPCLVQHLARLIVGQVDGGQVIQIGGAGHMSPLTHPAVIAAALRHHVATAERQRRRMTRAA